MFTWQQFIDHEISQSNGVMLSEVLVNELTDNELASVHIEKQQKCADRPQYYLIYTLAQWEDRQAKWKAYLAEQEAKKLETFSHTLDDGVSDCCGGKLYNYIEKPYNFLVCMVCFKQCKKRKDESNG